MERRQQTQTSNNWSVVQNELFFSFCKVEGPRSKKTYSIEFIYKILQFHLCDFILASKIGVTSQHNNHQKSILLCKFFYILFQFEILLLFISGNEILFPLSYKKAGKWIMGFGLEHNSPFYLKIFGDPFPWHSGGNIHLACRQCANQPHHWRNMAALNVMDSYDKLNGKAPILKWDLPWIRQIVLA